MNRSPLFHLAHDEIRGLPAAVEDEFEPVQAALLGKHAMIE